MGTVIAIVLAWDRTHDQAAPTFSDSRKMNAIRGIVTVSRRCEANALVVVASVDKLSQVRNECSLKAGGLNRCAPI